MAGGAENRLARFNEDRDKIVQTVAQRVVDARVRAADKSGDASLEYVLNDVAFQEMLRLGGRRDRKGRKQYSEWHQLATRLGSMTEADKRDRLRELSLHYARDVVGNFNERVYKFTIGLLPTALGLAFTPLSLSDGFSGMERLADRVQVQGPIELLRRLASEGTLVVAPTHSSNMDSIVIGFGLERAGLPPCTYGAGKNLFTNRLISFFMHNLGAYRIDRRLKFALYKDVLKEYSTALLEYGYHSLFFPGGTRCRSNTVENKLKLGLLGTGLKAFENTLRPIYVVPATINYHLVLEAETLVDDHLAEQGKSRYIIEDDEFSRLGRIVEFMRRMLTLEESVVVRFGRPLDLFGNEVDDDGRSLDPRGRVVDPSTYVQDGEGEVSDDDQRDHQYTRELGDALVRAYRRETVFLTTHLTARVLFDAVVELTRVRDVYRLLRVPRHELHLPIEEVTAGVAKLREEIARRPEVGMVHERVAEMSAGDIVDDALRVLGMYHTSPVAHRERDSICVDNPRLLYYYRNRTAHFEVG